MAEPVQRLIIYGASYTNLVWLVDAINRHSRRFELIGFVDDTPALQGTRVAGHPVLGGRQRIIDYVRDGVFCHNVQGSAENARSVAAVLDQCGCRIIGRLTHPQIDLFGVSHGRNFLVMPGNTFGVGVSIGDFVKIRAGCTIESEVTIGDYAFVGAGVFIGRGAQIGEGAFLDCCVQIRPGITIGASSIVAGRALVDQDVPVGTTVAGVPARPLGERA